MRRARFAWALALAALVLARALTPPLLSPKAFGRAVLDRRGQLLRLTLAADERYRLWVPLAQIAPELIEATLLYEDRWFFWHPGVNPVALVQAAFETFGGGRVRGGSTLTMQLARLRYGIDSRRVLGKVVQIVRAVQIELTHSKREILEAYLNLAPYGGNVEGVGAAGLIYFDRPAHRVSLAQALTLAVMPQDPSRRAPDVDGREPRALHDARRTLSQLWLARHPESMGAIALGEHLPMRQRRDLPFAAPHFVAAVLGDHPRDAFVRSTLDGGMQRLVERRTSAYVARHRSEGIVNAAVLLVDHRSMEVLAHLGSVDFGDVGIEGQVDGTLARRSPGSALKPFVYALALEQGLIHPLSLVRDAPHRYGTYNPENFDGEFAGPLSATAALVHSRNVPAVELQRQLRGAGLHDLMQRAHIAGLHEAGHYGLSIVLGGVEVTVKELVALYAMLAEGGELRELRRTLDAHHRLGERLLGREASFLVLDMLRHNPRPGQRFGADWVRDHVAVAWKTGTSFGFRDAWAVGVLGPYVLCVWVGNFDGRGNPIFVGRSAAGGLFFDLVDALRANVEGEHPEAPEGINVTQVRVCPVSGKLPGPSCRQTETTWFVPGISPIDTCDIHREVAIDVRSGRRACRADPQRTRTEVYEIWPSDLAQLFAAAGLPRREPPPYAFECTLDERAASGHAPEIRSPQAELVYSVRADALGTAVLPLSATADSDVHVLHWFVDGEYVGKSTRDEPLLWPMRPGQRVVRVVDDSGRANVRALRVALVQ